MYHVRPRCRAKIQVSLSQFCECSAYFIGARPQCGAIVSAANRQKAGGLAKRFQAEIRVRRRSRRRRKRLIAAADGRQAVALRGTAKPQSPPPQTAPPPAAARHRSAHDSPCETCAPPNHAHRPCPANRTRPRPNDQHRADQFREPRQIHRQISVDSSGETPIPDPAAEANGHSPIVMAKKQSHPR